MKVWMDFEFMENGATCTVIPLSAAYLASNDQALYLVITDADRSLANPFVVEHVLPHVDTPPTDEFTITADPAKATEIQVEQHGTITYTRCPRRDAGNAVAWWVAQQTPTPEFWAWCADYDWVCHAQLHGSMVNLPEGWPMFCNDLRQVRSTFPKDLVDPQAPKGLPEHHALADTYDLRARHRWHDYHVKARAAAAIAARSE